VTSFNQAGIAIIFSDTIRADIHFLEFPIIHYGGPVFIIDGKRNCVIRKGSRAGQYGNFPIYKYKKIPGKFYPAGDYL